MSERKLMRYVFYKVDQSWRHLPPEERALHKKELLDVITQDHGVSVHPYSTVGLREDADICFWEVADGPEPIQDLQARINGTGLGRHLEVTHSYLAMTRASMYTKEHKHAGQESEMPAGPQGGSYLFVYPMDKKREWYRVPFEDRRRIMGEHFRIGHKYPNVKIHTGYSFGIDDQEFVVAFEGESFGEFLDLVMELRESESSSYTLKDVPIFSCRSMPLDQILNQLDGS